MHQHPEPLAAPADSCKPFLKWAGGKQRLLAELRQRLPSGHRLIEPFVGAGSVFLALTYDSYVINDVNSDLISVWTALQARPREFMERAASLFVEQNRSQEAYLSIRAAFNAQADRFERAVMLPYLNRFGFNGLFRVNSAGNYNVPYGHPTRLPAFPYSEMETASRKLERTTILCGGFGFALDLAGLGDVVYCDPPYLDSDSGRSFTAYSKAGFSLHDHEELRESALRAVSRGATVVISNHDTEQTRQLYRSWQLEQVAVRRSVAAVAQARGLVTELIVTMPKR